MFFKPLLSRNSQFSDFGALSVLVGDSIVIDAGTIVTTMTRGEHLKITDIFLTHAHLDHIKDLGFLADSIYSDYKNTIKVHGTVQTIRAIMDHVFNGKIWADFTSIPNGEKPILTFKELKSQEKVKISGYEICPIPVNHIPGTTGFVVSRANEHLVITGDTGPTEKIWEHVNNLKGEITIYIETSFPNRLRAVADETGHLTPEALKGELSKIKKDAKIFVCHIKPPYHAEIIKELSNINDGRISILEQ